MDTRIFKDMLTQMQGTLECSICLELLCNPVSTRCDHQFCSFCITKFLQSKRSVPCPLCKRPVTKRGIQDRSELSQVINNVKQLIAAYEADTREKFTPSKTCKDVPPEAHNRNTRSKQVSDRQVKTSTQTTDCPDIDICHGDSTSTHVAVGESKKLHPLVTDSSPRTRSGRRGQVVCLDADTVVNLHVEESRRQSNADLSDIIEHRRSGRKRKLSFQSETSDNGNARQREKLKDDLGLHDDDGKPVHSDKDDEHQINNADILCYLEEGSCGAVQSHIPSICNENSKHVVSPCNWEVNSKQQLADSSTKLNSLEDILQPGNRKRKPCKNVNSNAKKSNNSSSKESVLESSKAKLQPCITDSSNPMPNIPTQCEGSSQNKVTDESCHDAETPENEVLEHDSWLDHLPLASNSETAEDVCRIGSPSSDVSSVSSTQQLLKPKPVTARTYSRDMRKSFHDGFVKNWADTLPEKNVATSNSLNQPKGLTTKEKIYAKKQTRHQHIRLKEEASSAETVEANNNSHNTSAQSEAIFEPPLAQVSNRKSIFKSRTQRVDNKSCVLDIAPSNEITNQEDPFEFTVGHTPVKPKRKIGAQQKGLKTDKTKDVSDCKIQSKNKKMNLRKCEVAVVQWFPLEHVSVSKLESTHESTKFNLSSTEVESKKTLRVSTGVSKTLEKGEQSSCAQTENLLNSVTKKNKTVHFDDDFVDVDILMQPTQGNVSIPEANLPAEVKATVLKENQQCMQEEVVTPNVKATVLLENQQCMQEEVVTPNVKATVLLENQQCMQEEVVTPNVAREQKGRRLSTAVPFFSNINKTTVDQKLQPSGDLLNSDKNVPMNYNREDLANESIAFHDTSVDVTLKEAPHVFINKQRNKMQKSPDGDASDLQPDSRTVSASAQKRKFARRRKKRSCPDTETFSQKAGKELTKLIHKINEAEDYELMFNTQDANKKVQEDLQKEQMLEEAFGFATQDLDHCRFSEAKDETESKTVNTRQESRPATTSAESKTTDTSTESKTAKTSTESKTVNTSTESKTANTSTESKTANTSTESKAANTSTESKTANTSTESKTANTSTESKTANTSTESKTANTSTESKTANTSTESKTANTSTETGDAHRVIQEVVDQSDHIEQINEQENQIISQQSTQSVMKMLKTNTHKKSKDLEVSSTVDKSVVTSIDIDNAGVFASLDISMNRKDNWLADFQGNDKRNSTLLEPLEFSSEHINQMLQGKKHNSLHVKEHVVTTPVDTRRARIFPRPNFSEMVQVSPCTKGVLAPTKSTLINSSATELHSSHVGVLPGKSNTSNISICEQPQMEPGGSYCDQSVNSKVQTFNIAVGNRGEKQDSTGFNALSMHCQIPMSKDEIPEYNPTGSSFCANKVLDGKLSAQVNAVGTKTRSRTALNTTQLSLKSKNTSEADFVSPYMGSERVANYALECGIILAPDTCVYSSSCRTNSNGSQEAGVILETLDFDTNLQYTNDVHSDHVVLSPRSPSKSHECEQKSTLNTVATPNRSEETIPESLILTTSSTQDPAISPQDSLPQIVNEECSSCWVDPKKTKLTGTAELVSLSSEKNNSVVQSAAIVVASQVTSSGGSTLSQSILLPTGACDKQGVHKNDPSHSDNCSRFPKLALDKNLSTCDNRSKSVCFTVPETPNSRASPKNQISSAPCRITCSESEDDDYVLIVRRKKRKCFSLDGSPLKPVVFGSDEKVLEENLTPETKNDEYDGDLIGETEAMRVIDTWTEPDVEDNDGKMSECYVSESLQSQQEETMYLTELRAMEEIRNSAGQEINKSPPELVERPAVKLQCVTSTGKSVSGLTDEEMSVYYSKRKSHKRLFLPSSGVTRCETNRQLENNSSEHRIDMTVTKLSDNVNEDNQPNKLTENVDIAVPETNDISQNDDDNTLKSCNNDAEDLLIGTGLDISLLENAAETSVTYSRSVPFELEKKRQTKRGLAKKGCLTLDTSVKHPRGQLSPASKAVVRRGIMRPTDQNIITDSDIDVIYVDTEEEDTVGVVKQDRTPAGGVPDGSNKCDRDLDVMDSLHVVRRQVKKLPVDRKGKKCKTKTTDDAKKQLEKELFGLVSDELIKEKDEIPADYIKNAFVKAVEKTATTSKTKTNETKYDAKKQLEKELFSFVSNELMKEKDKNHEMPAEYIKHAFVKAVEKIATTTCIGSVDDKDNDDELFFDLGDSSDDDGHVKMNARSAKNKSEKSGVVDELDDAVCLPGSLPITSSPLEAGNGCEHGDMDQSVITAVDETDIDDEDSVYTRPKSRAKRFQIASDSEDSNQEANPVRSSTNCTSSSALSSQSEILNTEQQEALEEDVAKLHQQIAEYEAKLAQEGGDPTLTPATQEERAGTKASTDKACDRHIPEEDEDSDDLFVSPLSPSPPPRQSSIKPVPKRPALSKPNRQTDQFIKQFQSPGGTVRTKKSLEFTSSTPSSHSQTNNLPLFSGKTHFSLGSMPLDQENVHKKQSSDRGFHDITLKNIVTADSDKMDQIMDINDSPEDKLMLSPIILSQKSRQTISQSEKRDVNSSVDNRCLKYPLDKDICLVASALGREEYLLMVKLAERNGLKFTSKFSTEVTHVVMKPATGYDRVCDRTLKFFQGVAYKCWVVSYHWVLDSLQTGSLLPEEDYEIVGDTSCGESTFGAKHSRLSRELLFTDFCLACVGDGREMPKENLQELLTVCGATVVDDPIGLLSKVAKFKIIVRCSDSNIAPTTAELDMFNGLYKHMGLLTVMREWVLDSLGSYRLQPLIEYVLNTGVTSVPF